MDLNVMQSFAQLSPQTFARLCLSYEERGQILELEQAIYYRCATDLELYARYFFAHYCIHPFSQLHFDDFANFKFGERKIRRVRAAPRGYAKSTFKAFIKLIHDFCYGLEKYIVLFSNTSDQALGKLKDIRAELLENRRLIRIYGIHFQNKRIAEGSFTAYAGDHSCKFEAYGTGAQIRGIKYGASRPSKLVFDDVEHSEEVENESLRAKYESWYFSDVIKAGDENTNVEFVGTVLHRRSLLMSLLNNPMYDAKKYKAILSWSEREDLWTRWREILVDLTDDDRLSNANAYYFANEEEMLRGTKVLWPEKEPYVYLMKELVEGGRLAFFKEKMNEPLGADDKVFTVFHWYREHFHPELGRGILIEKTNQFIPWVVFENYRAYAAMDPSTGQSKAKSGKMGDYTCILTGMLDPKGRIFVHHDWTKRAPPSKYIEQIFDQYEEFKYEKFAIETNLYRNLLLPNIIQRKKDLEASRKQVIKLPFYDIETVENKEKRIFTLEPKITNGWILFNRALSAEVYNQIEEFPKSDHDDVPDCLELLYGVVFNRYGTRALEITANAGR